jgi:sec-independent protein translocase protein TatA
MALGLFQNIGFPELMIILVVVLLLFGRRFPEVMRSIGKGIVELKKGLHEVQSDVESGMEASTQKSVDAPKAAEAAGEEADEAGAVAEAGEGEEEEAGEDVKAG